MFKFIRGRGHGHFTPDRIKDLFSLTRESCNHGFPHHPTAIAYDPSLSLIGIATKRSEVRVYGRPGVEYWGQVDVPESSNVIVKEIHFIPDQRGQFIILRDDGIIELWQIPAPTADDDSSNNSNNKLEKVTSTDHFARGESGSIRQGITMTVTSDCSHALVGTTGGNIFTIDLNNNFTVLEDDDHMIHQDSLVQSIPLEHRKSNQGSVEVISERPAQAGCFLIGYTRGLLVLYNNLTKSPIQVYNSAQQLESASWLSSGETFITSHNDGRYITWKVTPSSGSSSIVVVDDEKSKIPYGPFPCKPISKIVARSLKSGEQMLFFTGGMPRSTYGDKMTLSIIMGDPDSGKHQVLDFTSKVIDFLVIDDATKDNDPIALVVLLEEEIIVIDVQHETWLPYKLPYLNSVHSSGITSCQHYADITDQLYQDIIAAGAKQDEGRFSTSEWPITGGSVPVIVTSAETSDEQPVTQPAAAAAAEAEEPQDVIPGVTDAAVESGATDAAAAAEETDGACLSVAKDEKQAEKEVESTEPTAAGAVVPSPSVSKGSTKDILITGHEDGSIQFWDASHSNLKHILTINTRKYFTGADGVEMEGDEGAGNSPEDAEEGSEWPPFRKIGTFDPYSDDTRLAIRRLSLCPMTGVFSAAGTAGQVIYFKLNPGPDSGVPVLPVHSVNLVEETTGFAWKGHEQLIVKTSAIKTDPAPGYEAEFVIQITPPAATTALSLNTEWNILAAGTAHGFVVFDLMQNKVILSKCTLNPADLAATAGGDVLISRRKSFKKSLRESFRRLRRGRGASTRVKKVASSSAESSPEKTTSGEGAAAAVVTSPVRSIVSADDALDSKPVERQIEARQDDGLGSMIRSISYATANITSAASPVPTIWIGTNAGSVLIYTITLPEDDEKRQEGDESVLVQLAKEIQLKHRAPVIYIQVIDSTGYPLPGPYEVMKGKAKAASTIGHQKVLIISEEQFKLFSLPSLKPDRKSKLTAHEGSRARKVTIASFPPGIPKLTVKEQPQQKTEYCITCCSNQGDVSVYSITDLKRIQHHEVIRREDVHGISSVVLTTRGEGLFLHSASEFQRFSLSAQKKIQPEGLVTIPDGVRPVFVVPIEKSAEADATEVPVPVPEVPVEENTTDHAASSDVTADEEKAKDIARAVVESAIREETEEEVTQAEVDPPPPVPPNSSASIHANAAPAADLLSSVRDEVPIASSTPFKTQDSTISSSTHVPAGNLLESELNGNDDEEPMQQDTVVTSSSAAVHHVPAVNGNLNGNGHKNGHHFASSLDEDDDSSDGQLNGQSSPNHADIDTSANASVLTADITIDSVRDFTNLTLSEGKKKTDSSSASAPSAAAVTSEGPLVEIGATTTSEPPESTAAAAAPASASSNNSSTPRPGKNSNIPRSNSNRGGGGGGGGSGARRKNNRSHANKQQQQQRNSTSKPSDD